MHRLSRPRRQPNGKPCFPDVRKVWARRFIANENLRAQKESLEKLGVPAEIRIRHGMVLDQVFKEVREGRHDLIVTGSSPASGAIRHYVMGNLTRSILNRAECSVLVARAGAAPRPGFLGTLRQLFGAKRAETNGSSA